MSNVGYTLVEVLIAAAITGAVATFGMQMILNQQVAQNQMSTVLRARDYNELILSSIENTFYKASDITDQSAMSGGTHEAVFDRSFGTTVRTVEVKTLCEDYSGITHAELVADMKAQNPGSMLNTALGCSACSLSTQRPVISVVNIHGQDVRYPSETSVNGSLYNGPVASGVCFFLESETFVVRTGQLYFRDGSLSVRVDEKVLRQSENEVGIEWE